MKLRILSFLLVLMLVSFPVTHVLAMSIQEDCQKTFTEDDLRIYIKNHAFAGHREHGAVVDIDRNDFYPKNECNDRNHNHKQLMKTIVVKEVWKMQYKCLDQNGDKWRIDIEGKVGRDWGVYWNDETLWKNAIPSPCATREYGHVYDLNRIDRNELLRLFNFMVSVDQYLDQTQGSKIIKGLAADFIGGASSIASALYTLAKYGGRIPYIGEAVLVGVGVASSIYTFSGCFSLTIRTRVLVGVGVASSIYTLIKVTDELHKIDVLKKQTANTAKNILRFSPSFTRGN